MNRQNRLIRIAKKARLNKLVYGLIQVAVFISYCIKYRGFSWGRLMPFKELLSENPDIKILCIEEIKLSYVPPRFDEQTEKEVVFKEGREYTKYAVIVKNTIILAGSNLIVPFRKTVLYDLPSYDLSKKYKYSDEKVIRVCQTKIGYWKGITQKEDKAIWMGGNFSWNYYHLLYEFIIKFRILEKLKIPAEIPVLIDSVCLEIPQFQELVDMVNHKGRRIIAVNKKHSYALNELYYINCPNLIPPNLVNDHEILPEDVQFDTSLLQDLRNYLLPFSSGRKFPSRIFISRKNASGRRTFNEEEIIKLFSGYGFEVVYPETMSIRDQIALFNQAEYIAGGTGAAFTNLLFGSDTCTAIVFNKTRLPFSGFSTIAYISGVDLRYITEEATQGNQLKNTHDSFEIDLLHIQKLLQKWDLQPL